MATSPALRADPTATVLAEYPVLARFLAAPLRHFIGGAWREGVSPATIPVIDPGTGLRIASIAAGDAADVDAAVQAATRAFTAGSWSRLTPAQRAPILHRLAALIERDTALLVALESLDVGKPRAQAAGFDIPHAAATFRYYADLAVQRPLHAAMTIAGHEAYTARTPYGPCGFIIPWNFPFMLVGWGLAPALAAGNPVVVKPAEDTSLSTLYFCELAREAGIPPGVVNVVTGSGEVAGAALARHPGLRRMSFTGSPEVGREVGRACAGQLIPAKLELGGKGAAVLFDDIPVEAAVTALCGALSLNAGQVCCTATRWLVQRRIWDQVVASASRTLQGLTIGHGAAAATQLGPLVSAKQRERVLGYLARGRAAGAQMLLAGGAAAVADAPGGFYCRPALMTGSPDNPCAVDEVFGPVAYLLPFDTAEEAVSLVNRSAYGLANSVWSADLQRARQVGEALIAGNAWLNAHNVFPHGVSYGGCNLSGLGGGVLGPDCLDDYLRPQSVVRPYST